MILSAVWLPASLLAGLFQAWRTALQQRLRAQLTVNGAGLVRYAYGAPVAILLALAWLAARGIAWPRVDAVFLGWTAGAGLAQILGTNLLIRAFGYRNFVVGTAFSKTETAQVAIVAWLALGERLTGLVIAGLLASVAGVLTLALGGRQLRPRDVAGALGQPAALCGLGAGAMFAITGVLVKQATRRLDMPDLVAAALVTLVATLVAQTMMLGAWVAWREPATWRRVAATWRTSGQVGVLAALGSACWFAGFATAPLALVRVVGQVEVLFTLGFARFFLHERTRPHEVAGLLLVAAGVVLALLGTLRD
jgi:drug/metabolite transporter (DMT)-like permease